MNLKVGDIAIAKTLVGWSKYNGHLGEITYVSPREDYVSWLPYLSDDNRPLKKNPDGTNKPINGIFYTKLEKI